MPADISLLLCEDIRREDNGKYILIGIFNEGINAYKLPLSTALSTFISIRNCSAGEHKLQIMVSLPNQEKTTSQPTTIFVEEGNSNATGIIHSVPIVTDQEGTLEIYAWLDDDEPVLVLGIPVMVQKDKTIEEDHA